MARKLKSLDKRQLFGERYRDDVEAGDPQLEQRQQLLSGTDRLERSSNRIRESQRIALETEDIGRNVLGDLGRQRETIENTRGRLLESEGYTDRSIKTLRGMARRMATNKIITIAIITVLVLLIIAVIRIPPETDLGIRCSLLAEDTAYAHKPQAFIPAEDSNKRRSDQINQAIQQLGVTRPKMAVKKPRATALR
ncbi:hypothetical protein LTS18_011039 [Coniosporium uncinatum]|uniref:Uncharacterized protein n=1 Tax=Coniosporium uncinatum TaxID=93489 RepID=A0ACC3DKQ4_9PEZI|nr:hypothetical protein LTS18_011039 [Coniosporium uncinatum]